MASFGHVLDLLDKRYLNLHDVVGNVEPMPTLVPYEDYGQAVLVLRMDTHHELFMGLIHEFTARMAQETRQELWTWLVQWKVEGSKDLRLKAAAPLPKKPRLETPGLAEQEMQPRAPTVDIFERCIIRPELMKEEDLLRILLDIVQVDSTIVPNFIEFLYRWIDFYEGDGTALKAALKWEIPSLWDFEHHPLVLPSVVRRQMENDNAEKGKDREETNTQKQGNTPMKMSRAQELAQGAPTKKMREKPDLAAMERQAQESERSQYREVRYGIRPPKLNLPITPLINIPLGQVQRLKYYAASFKSRHRALVHLMESGLNMQQISNYQKLQKEHPKDTPKTLDGGPLKELKGLRHYYKDAEAAQGMYTLKEKLQLRREKQKEIAISSKLAVEARLAAATPTPGSNFSIPLIPPTPSYTRPPDMARDMLCRIQAAKSKGPDRINFVPAPVVGMMNSDLFVDAIDRQSLTTARPTLAPSNEPLPRRPIQADDRVTETDEEEDDDNGDVDEASDEEGSAGDESSEDDDDDPSQPPHPAPAPPVVAHHPSLPILTGGLPVGAQPQNAPNVAGASPLHGRQTATVHALFQYLAPEQARDLLPLTDLRSRQILAADIARRMPADQALMSVNTTLGAHRHASSGMPNATTTLYPYMNGNANAGMTTGAGHPKSASMLYVPSPPIRPPTASVTPEGNRSTLPFLRPPLRPLTHATTPASGSEMPFLGQRSVSFQSRSQSSASMPQHASSSIGQMTPQEVLGLPAAPQASLPQHDVLRGSATRPLPASLVSGPQTGGLENQTATSYVHLASPASPSMQYPASPPITVTPYLAQWSQADQSRAATRSQGSGDTRSLHDQLMTPNIPQPLQRSIILAPLSSDACAGYQTQLSPSPSAPMLSPPRPGIQRNAPAPLNLPSAPTSSSPFSSLGPSLLATTPFLPNHHGIPVQMYFPKIVVPGNSIGPGGRRMGTQGTIETDALMIGHTHPRTGKITLSKALFLPLGVWTNTQKRVDKKAYSMIETYAPPKGHPAMKGKIGAIGDGPCHPAVYRKLSDAYNLMRSSSAKQRELDVTKRWRASKGPITQQDRGAVWEGYGVTLDKPIEMTAKEREGAIIFSWIVDEGVDNKPDSRKTKEELEVERSEMELGYEEDDEDGMDWAEALRDDGDRKLTWGQNR